MKKKLIILITIVLGVLAVGCSNNEVNQQYEQAMADGKSKVIEEEYDKAIDYFKLALESKEDDAEAKNLIEQLNLLLEVEDAESHGAYFFQIGKLEKIEAIKTETNVVKEKASKYKELAIKNIDDWINDIENSVNNAEYDKAQEDIDFILKDLKKYDCLKDQLERCNKLLETCKEKKKEAEKQVSNNSEKVWCSGVGIGYEINSGHYVDKNNAILNYGVTGSLCYGCMLKKQLGSTGYYEDCPVCGNTCAVSRYYGKCQYCGEKVYPAIKKIYDDGTAILEDGTKFNW